MLVMCSVLLAVTTCVSTPMPCRPMKAKVEKAAVSQDFVLPRFAGFTVGGKVFVEKRIFKYGKDFPDSEVILYKNSDDCLWKVELLVPPKEGERLAAVEAKMKNRLIDIMYANTNSYTAMWLDTMIQKAKVPGVQIFMKKDGGGAPALQYFLYSDYESTNVVIICEIPSLYTEPTKK